MQQRPATISFPRLAAAITETGARGDPTARLDNRTALGFALRFYGPSFAIATAIGLALFSVMRGPNPVALVGGGAFMGVLSAVVISREAPSSIDLTSEGMIIHGRSRAVRVPSAITSTVLFIVSLKEASRSDHERFFDTRVAKTDGKQFRIGFVSEGVVADLLRWLPHSKVTIRVVSYRPAWELHPKDVPRSGTPPVS